MSIEQLVQKLSGVAVERNDYADNLAIVLATYFDGHMDCPPKDINEDGDRVWSLWVERKTKDALEYIAEQLEDNDDAGT